MTVIYLDNAATTPVATEVVDLMRAIMLEDYGNPSSAHEAGIRAEAAVKRAHSQLLSALGDPSGRLGKLYFTSGGTESDALGVMGAARAHRRRGRHILYSAIEHPAVVQAAKQLSAGCAEEPWQAEAVPVGESGVLSCDDVVARVRPDTTVIAVMLVNNEIGTIQPVADIARAAKAINPHVHVHCDCVQALGKVAFDVAQLGADSVAVAAHKLHGPKGVGALWLRKGARIVPLWSGGGQQEGMRSGTLNVPGIAGFGQAVALAMDGLRERTATWQRFGERLVEATRNAAATAVVHGAQAPRAGHILSVGFRGIVAEPLMHVLESRGVLVSAGSACAAQQGRPSAVLQAIGVGRDMGTLRISFGRQTTAADIEQAGQILVEAVADM